MQSRIIPAIIALSVTSVLLSGCESIGSDDIKTSGIYAKFTATDDETTSGNDVQVRAALVVGGSTSNTYVDLNDTGDTLYVDRDGAVREPRRREGTLGDIYYTHTFGGVTNEATFSANLERLDDVSAPNSSVQIPQPFSINSSETIFDITNNNTIDFTWTVGDFSSFGSTSYSITGGCISGVSGALNLDAGSLSISTATVGPIQADAQGVKPTSCAITAKFTHGNSGSVDPAFKGGYFRAYRVVTKSMTIQD